MQPALPEQPEPQALRDQLVKLARSAYLEHLVRLVLLAQWDLKALSALPV